MKLKSFNIKNFRSIVDSSCILGSDLTVLAGKNESGKTTILDALTSLNDDIKFNENDRPLQKETDEDTIIQYNFELTNEEKEECLKNYNLTGKDFSNEVSIQIIHNNDEYNIAGPFMDDAKRKLGRLSETDRNFINKNLDNINEYLEATHDDPIELFQSVDYEKLDKLSEKLEEVGDAIPKHPQTHNSTNPEFESVLNEFKLKVDELRTKLDKIEEIIWSKKPRIVKFSSFDDALPSTVPYSEFTEERLKADHKIVYDLARLADFDFQKIHTDDVQIRENLTEKASRITTNKFKEFWNQNPIEFIFRVSEPHVSIFIRDLGKDVSYKPEQRSKGFQWFLSFYLRLEAEGLEENNLILIDEPELDFNAKAQHDVLTVLENESKKNQIIFTTHSPYLIDPDELHRVRLVVKDEKDEQTVITSSFYKGGDADTLTPIITAIGLDLSKDLFFSKVLNVVLEGISDYYYLRAMITYLKNVENGDRLVLTQVCGAARERGFKIVPVDAAQLEVRGSVSPRSLSGRVAPHLRRTASAAGR